MYILSLNWEVITVDSLEEIKVEIENVRKKLGQLLEHSDNFNTVKILEISRDLDKLILKYFQIK
jgi:uncharacterized protein YjaG (DUF416 family)